MLEPLPLHHADPRLPTVINYNQTGTFIYQSVCLYIYLSNPYFLSPIYRFIYVFINPRIYLSIVSIVQNIYLYLSIYIPNGLSRYELIYLSI